MPKVFWRILMEGVSLFSSTLASEGVPLHQICRCLSVGAEILPELHLCFINGNRVELPI